MGVDDAREDRGVLEVTVARGRARRRRSRRARSTTRPCSIGGPSTGSTQSAESSVIRPRWPSPGAICARRSRRARARPGTARSAGSSRAASSPGRRPASATAIAVMTTMPDPPVAAELRRRQHADPDEAEHEERHLEDDRRPRATRARRRSSSPSRGSGCCRGCCRSSSGSSGPPAARCSSRTRIPATVSRVARATSQRTPRCVLSSNAGARNDQSCQRMIGSEISSAAYSDTVTEVRNGSATPKVIGCRLSAGSGWFSQWMIRWWKTYVTVSDSATAPSTTKMRLRSSSRCSTSVASSPCCRRRGRRFMAG